MIRSQQDLSIGTQFVTFKNYEAKAKFCRDCTSPTPFCCGYGPCNMFCCNCDKGCRKGNNDVCASCPKDGPKCKPPVNTH
uniref:Metallothionein n=1 Tax=Romanomermis culicivorax TaxID=13658 RepID=A0A915HX69_ROMCU